MIREWPIKEVAQATGLTSRTLRHYEQIGLLLPSRVAYNGYRFYGQPQLSRLYRILSLRALELPLATIGQVLEDEVPLAEAIASHLAQLEAQRERTDRQILAVRQALDAVTKGKKMSIKEIFDGVDPNQYESEVRERWGNEAWERSAKRREAMTEEELRADTQRGVELNGALRDAAERGLDPTSSSFQTLVATHHRWVTEQWGGRVPGRESYNGLAELYVADERFADAYGGVSNAEIIRTAIQFWIAQNLTD